MPVQFYPAMIDRSASGFGVSFPDFPGCIAAGDTINEAAVSAEAALAFHVETMLKDGDKLPEPSDLITGPPEPNDVAGILVRVDAPAKVARVLVSIDESLLRQIDAVASNRSSWLADAARASLAANRSRPTEEVFAMSGAKREARRRAAADSAIGAAMGKRKTKAV